MANTIFRSNHQSKAFHAFGFFCLVLLMQKGQTREFTVGGSNWSVRTNGTYTESYNQWAERNRFQTGDSLVFIYPPNEDSVLHVMADAYNNCSTDAALEKYADGRTVFDLNRSGPFYFISGNKENCLKGEKLVVVVLADRTHSSSNTSQTAPAASPLPSNSTDIVPVPAPSSESPPMVEINPTPAPVEQPPPPSASSSLFTGAATCIGAFLASSVLLTAL